MPDHFIGRGWQDAIESALRPVETKTGWRDVRNGAQSPRDGQDVAKRQKGMVGVFPGAKWNNRETCLLLEVPTRTVRLPIPTKAGRKGRWGKEGTRTARWLKAKNAPPSSRGPAKEGISGSKSTLMFLVEQCIGHFEGDPQDAEVAFPLAPPDLHFSSASTALCDLPSTRFPAFLLSLYDRGKIANWTTKYVMTFDRFSIERSLLGGSILSVVRSTTGPDCYSVQRFQSVLICSFREHLFLLNASNRFVWCCTFRHEDFEVIASVPLFCGYKSSI